MSLINFKKLLSPFIVEDPEFYDWDAEAISMSLTREPYKSYYKKLGYSEHIIHNMINAISAFLKHPEYILESEINFNNFCAAQTGQVLSVNKLILQDEFSIYIGTRILLDLMVYGKNLNKNSYVFEVCDTISDALDLVKVTESGEFLKWFFDQEGYVLMPYPLSQMWLYCDHVYENEILEGYKPEVFYTKPKFYIETIQKEKDDIALEELKAHVKLYSAYKHFKETLLK
jgi:hypothetical protein